MPTQLSINLIIGDTWKGRHSSKETTTTHKNMFRRWTFGSFGSMLLFLLLVAGVPRNSLDSEYTGVDTSSSIGTILLVSALALVPYPVTTTKTGRIQRTVSLERTCSRNNRNNRNTVRVSQRSFRLMMSITNTNNETTVSSSEENDLLPTASSTNNLRPGSLAAATKAMGRVPYGESSRQYRRTVYVRHDDWVGHRDSKQRLWNNLRGILLSGIVRQLQSEIWAITSVAMGVVLWNDWIGPALLASSSSSTLLTHLSQLTLPSLPFTLSSPALGLLLVFRTNASYSRWVEARTLWSRIISQCRNIGRMTFSSLGENSKYDEETQQKARSLCFSVWMFPRVLMNELSGPQDDETFCEEIQRECQFWGDDQTLQSIQEGVLSAERSKRSMIALMEVSLALESLPLDEKRRMEIDKSLVLIGDCLAGCQRIYSGPVPLVYTRHTARFLSIWMILVPFAMYDAFGPGLAMIAAVSLISLFLFGIEELAIQLEEPFTILPMQKFCDDILRDCKLMLEWSQRRKR